MKFYTAVLAWLVIGGILVGGIVMAAAAHNFWLLGLGTLAFVGAFAKYGCASH
jgi:hypothetical protein